MGHTAPLPWGAHLLCHGGTQTGCHRATSPLTVKARGPLAVGQQVPSPWGTWPPCQGAPSPLAVGCLAPLPWGTWPLCQGATSPLAVGHTAPLLWGAAQLSRHGAPRQGGVGGGGGTCRPRRGVAPTRQPSCRRRRPCRPCGTARPRQRRRRRRPGGPERVREPGAAAQAPPLTAAAASPRSRGGAKVLKRISLLGVKVSDFGSLRAPRLPARRRPGGPRRGPRPPALPVSTAAGWRLAGPGTAGDPGGKLPSLRGGGRRVGAWPASLASCRAVPNRAGPVPGRTVGMAGRGCDPPVPAGAESGAPRGRGDPGSALGRGGGTTVAAGIEAANAVARSGAGTGGGRGGWRFRRGPGPPPPPPGAVRRAGGWGPREGAPGRAPPRSVIHPFPPALRVPTGADGAALSSLLLGPRPRLGLADAGNRAGTPGPRFPPRHQPGPRPPDARGPGRPGTAVELGRWGGGGRWERLCPTAAASRRAGRRRQGGAARRRQLFPLPVFGQKGGDFGRGATAPP